MEQPIDSYKGSQEKQAHQGDDAGGELHSSISNGGAAMAKAARTHGDQLAGWGWGATISGGLQPGVVHVLCSHTQRSL